MPVPCHVGACLIGVSNIYGVYSKQEPADALTIPRKTWECRGPNINIAGIFLRYQRNQPNSHVFTRIAQGSTSSVPVFIQISPNRLIQRIPYAVRDCRTRKIREIQNSVHNNFCFEKYIISFYLLLLICFKTKCLLLLYL